MAKKKSSGNSDKVQVDTICALADKMGGEILSRVDSVKTWIDTGVFALNFLCSGKFMGGGIPSGKIMEIFGPSSSCKTLFATNILKGVQKAGGIAVFLDAENTLSKDFAEKASKLQADKVIVLKANSLEQAFAKINTAIRAIREVYPVEIPVVIVYDSIAASPSEREFEETKLEEEALAKCKDRVADRAKTINKELRKLTPVLENNNVTCLFINQVRVNVGVFMGNPEVTPGGKSLEFYSTLRIRTQASKRFKDDLENVIGMNVSVKNVKNKVFRPFIETHGLQLFFDQGINPVSGLLELLMRDGRIELVSQGNYRVSPEFSGGEEIKFKSSKERNDIPIEVLVKCPSIIDAESPQQVEEYLQTFQSGIEASDIVASSEDLNEDSGS